MLPAVLLRTSMRLDRVKSYCWVPSLDLTIRTFPSGDSLKCRRCVLTCLSVGQSKSCQRQHAVNTRRTGTSTKKRGCKRHHNESNRRKSIYILRIRMYILGYIVRSIYCIFRICMYNLFHTARLATLHLGTHNKSSTCTKICEINCHNPRSPLPLQAPGTRRTTGEKKSSSRLSATNILRVAASGDKSFALTRRRHGERWPSCN